MYTVKWEGAHIEKEMLYTDLNCLKYTFYLHFLNRVIKIVAFFIISYQKVSPFSATATKTFAFFTPGNQNLLFFSPTATKTFVIFTHRQQSSRWFPAELFLIFYTSFSMWYEMVNFEYAL